MQYSLFSAKQLSAMLWWNMDEYKDKDAVICDGSIRSGKTVSMTVGFILWSMSRFEGQTFAICGKTIESLRRNVITPMRTKWLKGIVEIGEHRSNNSLTIKKGKVQNTYYLFGGKDEGSAALIQGVTLAGALLDEVALMPRSFVEQAIARCSVEGSRFWFNCNPENPYHWFYDEWIKRCESKNALHLHFTMDDNYSLSDSIRKRYEHMYTGLFYDRFILGLWSMAQGVIYDMFRTDKHVKPFTERYFQQFISIDYGTYNPCVFLDCRRKEIGGSALYHIEREYYYDGRTKGIQKTDEEYLDDLDEFCAGNRRIPLLIDPSAASFITGAKRRGWQVLSVDNAVLPGIRTVASMLQKDRLTISENCLHTIEEFHSYVWDEKAGETGTDAPIKKNDHCMDALRYFVYRFERKGGVRSYDHKPF